MSEQRRLAVGIDVGGTKAAGVLVDPEHEGAIVERALVETPADDAEATIRTVVGLARELIASRDDVAAVGLGAAGMVDLQGVLRFAPNVAWRDAPLATRIARAVGLPTTVENDANAAAWGEFRFGAGRGSADMLLLTVGTGIGGGIVSGGRLIRGAHGFGAEVGHIIVEPGGPRCGCGNLGCWEQVASGRAIDRLGREAAVEHPDTLIADLAGDPRKVSGRHVTEAARRGDRIAAHIIEEVGRRLGQGIGGLVNVLDPDVVVIGGGVVEAGEPFLEAARRAYLDAVQAPAQRPDVPILAAALGNEAGAVGAADLALQRLSGAAPEAAP